MSCAKHDIITIGESLRLEPTCGSMGLCMVVDADLTEINSKPLLHLAAYAIGQRLSAA